MIRIAKTRSGFALTELLVSIAIFTLTVTGVIAFAQEAYRASANSQRRVEATLSLQETANALVANKNDLWVTIVQSSDGSPRHLEFVGDKYVINNGSVSRNGITFSFTVTQASRDSNGNLVSAGDIADPHTRAVNINAQWVDISGQPQNISHNLFISDWQTLDWEQTTVSEFDAGIADQTHVTNSAGGEVELLPVLYADWCKPQITVTEYDLPGTGGASFVQPVPGTVHTGSGSSTSSYNKLSFTPSDPPSIQNLGSFGGYTTVGIFAEGNYTYLATTNNSKEVVIVDNTTFTEVGYFNTPNSSTDSNSVFVVGNVGVLTAGSRIYTFNLTQKTGSRPQLDSETISATGTEVQVVGNYAYVSIAGAARELEIYNISNPSNMSKVGWADVNSAAAVSLYVSPDGTRTYLVTGLATGSGQSEFFIINTTTKVGNQPNIGTYNVTNGLDPAEVVVPVPTRAILVGSGSSEEYTVLNLNNEANPVRCGGLNLANNASEVGATTEVNGNVYSFVVTSQSNAELKVIRGGLGGGDGTGNGFAVAGEYISVVLDTGKPQSYFYSIDPQSSVPPGTTLLLQVRAGSSPDLSGVPWVGPDGTGSSYFQPSGSFQLPTSLGSNQYLQWRALFGSDTVSTPELQSVTISYQ